MICLKGLRNDGKLEDSSLVGCYTMFTGKLIVIKDEGNTVLPRQQQLFTCQHDITS
jgi:hypothetical protein